jgi:hypothetical protein
LAQEGLAETVQITGEITGEIQSFQPLHHLVAEVALLLAWDLVMAVVLAVEALTQREVEAREIKVLGEALMVAVAVVLPRLVIRMEQEMEETDSHQALRAPQLLELVVVVVIVVLVLVEMVAVPIVVAQPQLIQAAVGAVLNSVLFLMAVLEL